MCAYNQRYGEDGGKGDRSGTRNIDTQLGSVALYMFWTLQDVGEGLESNGLNELACRPIGLFEADG
jgi:hypothetical protein